MRRLVVLMSTDEALALLDLRGIPTLQEIRAARKLQLKVWHPDRFQNDPAVHAEAERRTKNINEAYETLERSFGPNGFRPSVSGTSQPEQPSTNHGRPPGQRTTPPRPETPPTQTHHEPTFQHAQPRPRTRQPLIASWRELFWIVMAIGLYAVLFVYPNLWSMYQQKSPKNSTAPAKMRAPAATTAQSNPVTSLSPDQLAELAKAKFTDPTLSLRTKTILFLLMYPETLETVRFDEHTDIKSLGLSSLTILKPPQKLYAIEAIQERELPDERSNIAPTAYFMPRDHQWVTAYYSWREWFYVAPEPGKRGGWIPARSVSANFHP